MLIHKRNLLGIAILASLGLSGCGGGGSGSGASSSSSGLSSGVISGFGSVFVNGVEYETASSRITVDGSPSTEDRLKVGMRVTLRGSINPDGRSGSASSIDYADELEGIVQSTSLAADGTGSLVVMGITVQVDNSTFFESRVPGIAGSADISAGNVIEVSGHRLDDTTVQATLIEVKSASFTPGSEIEVKGVIGSLTATSFRFGGMTIDYSSAQLDNIPGGTLSEGLYVEVKSIAGFDGSGNLIASKVELESNGDRDIDASEGEDIKLFGPIDNGSSASRFSVDGTTVVVNGNTRFEHGTSASIADGVEVKVEGVVDASGDLVATEIAFKEAPETELEAVVESVDPAANTLVVMGLTVTVDNFTMFRDDRSGNPVRRFRLDDLNPGTDRVEVDLFQDNGSGQRVARKLKREDGAGPDKLEGVVDGAPAPGQISVGGVSVDISGVGATPATGDKVDIRGNYNVGTGILTATSLTLVN